LGLRANVHVVGPGDPVAVPGANVKLEKSTHCLGAVQAAVELPSGEWVGYSGDFSWPLDHVNRVDQLVVDATYGDPRHDRGYEQGDAQEALIQQVRERLREGPIHLLAQGGTAERALALLAQEGLTDEAPVVGTKRFCAALEVHRELGFPVPSGRDERSPEGLAAIQDGRYIRVWGLNQSVMNDALPGAAIQLTKYRTYEVVEEIGDRLLKIGFSNHADFAGTMEYIERTGAQFVLTDGTRSSSAKARALAAAVIRELGVEAKAAFPAKSYDYGR
jgi:putative mRNA 3-end processing factor